MQVRSLGWEDPLEEMAIHFSILAWRIPWIEEPGAPLWGRKKAVHDLGTKQPPPPSPSDPRAQGSTLSDH